MRDDAWRRAAQTRERLVQGYLCLDPERVVRVRLGEGRGALTVKGRARGATRSEFEYAIPPEEAAELLELCVQPLLAKTRWRVRHGGHLWEVDEFEGANAGLVIAEVELGSEQEAVEIPPWAGEEVTGDPRYTNASLVTRPFRAFRDSEPDSEPACEPPQPEARPEDRAGDHPGDGGGPFVEGPPGRAERGSESEG